MVRNILAPTQVYLKQRWQLSRKVLHSTTSELMGVLEGTAEFVSVKDPPLDHSHFKKNSATEWLLYTEKVLSPILVCLVFALTHLLPSSLDIRDSFNNHQLGQQQKCIGVIITPFLLLQPQSQNLQRGLKSI